MKNINEIFKDKKKVITLIVYGIIILGALVYIATQDKITTITYLGIDKTPLCNETYINNKLVSPVCEQNKMSNMFKSDIANNITFNLQWNNQTK
jgi:hypothetical protein